MATASSPSRRRPSIVLILVGSLVFLFGLRIPAAQFLGVTTAGVITGIEPETSSSSDPMDYNYNISYTFEAAGRQQHGSYMVTRAYDVSVLPDIGTAVQVHYLPGLTFVNFADGQESVGLSTLLILLAGAVIIILGASGRGRLGKSRRSP